MSEMLSCSPQRQRSTICLMNVSSHLRRLFERFSCNRPQKCKRLTGREKEGCWAILQLKADFLNKSTHTGKNGRLRDAGGSQLLNVIPAAPADNWPRNLWFKSIILNRRMSRVEWTSRRIRRLKTVIQLTPPFMSVGDTKVDKMHLPGLRALHPRAPAYILIPLR